MNYKQFAGTSGRFLAIALRNNYRLGEEVKEKDQGLFKDLIEAFRQDANTFMHAYQKGDQIMLPLITERLRGLAEFQRRAVAEQQWVAKAIDEISGEGYHAYVARLLKHDWFFGFSDDEKVRTLGAAEEVALGTVAQEKGGDHMKAWDYFINRRDQTIANRSTFIQHE